MKTMKKQICIVLAIIMIAVAAIPAMTVSADWDPKPTKITRLNYSKRSVKAGREFTLKAYASPYDFDDDYLAWKTSNSKVVAFEDHDRTGDDMDFVAKKKGTATVTCYIRGTNIKKTCKVTVTSAGKAKIVVDDTYMDIDRYEWEDIEARLVGGTYKNRGLTYTVKNKKICKVKNGYVYGKKVGKTTITIRAKANKSIKKTITVRVERD